MFYGGEEELRTMNRRYEKNRFECIVIYGRRRVGKTNASVSGGSIQSVGGPAMQMPCGIQLSFECLTPRAAEFAME